MRSNAAQIITMCGNCGDRGELTVGEVKALPKQQTYCDECKNIIEYDLDEFDALLETRARTLRFFLSR
jgi:hypothetical protein